MEATECTNPSSTLDIVRKLQINCDIDGARCIRNRQVGSLPWLEFAFLLHNLTLLLEFSLKLLSFPISALWTGFPWQ